MSKLVRYGLLGSGMMGQEHIRNLALIDGAQVVAIIEPNPQMRERSLALAPGAATFDSLEEMLQSDIKIDALVIVTPNYQHADQLLTLFERTELPILVEKPVVTSLEQAVKVHAAASKHPAPVWVAMEYRYMPPVAKFRQQISSGDLGDMKMLSIREHRFPFLEKVNDWNRFNRQTGGTLVEKCCHFFDLMRLIVESEAVRVYASTGQDANHLNESYSGEMPDIIDNAYVIVDFANGKRASLDLNMFAEGSRYQEEICAIGPKAKLECFVPGPGRFWPTDTLGPAPIPKVVISPRNPKGPIELDIPVDETLLEAGDHNGSTFYQHLGFYKAITEGNKVDVTIEDGLKAVVLGLAAQESARTGRAIEIIENGLSYQ
ncbi:Gfo/Idh/MocA family protein [Marinobacterium sp. LSUCC0821]|jgi:predicted dehydrogenase|uniref:Gfo/Idh/MocA family protein n=1 Tax=Marinobacterium sp. LSUCC0821 TaxID=2668067 RepID=UPI001451ABFE|nr:Gfo/Idh/MocA family oxidoreductase [Marinobacterium sp. LSUCC0821]QJD71737.1 Gfo/Idh/MocA family oxidoreductase [Marinobacterium sp. LSUCC0821]